MAKVAEAVDTSRREMTISGGGASSDSPVLVTFSCPGGGCAEQHSFVFDRAALLEVLRQELNVVDAISAEASHFTEADRELMGWE